MANHLEDLVAEWLEFNGYFVRKSVLVGKRELGGFDGELDVVGLHPRTKHLLHIECSLDAIGWAKRHERFALKFDRGRKFVASLFDGLEMNSDPDQVALLQNGGGDRSTLGGARLVWVSEFIREVMADLGSMPPDKQAVPSNYPLLRTLQLAAQPFKKRPLADPLVPAETIQIRKRLFPQGLPVENGTA